MKIKHLPRAEFEEEGADRIQVRRVISRRNPVKTMFMGVVFQPQPEHNVDGKITMNRISKKQAARERLVPSKQVPLRLPHQSADCGRGLEKLV